MRSFRRHLIITILRKEEGFEIEQMAQPDEYSTLLLELVERISALTGVAFSQDDMADCQRSGSGQTSYLPGTHKGYQRISADYRGEETGEQTPVRMEVFSDYEAESMELFHSGQEICGPDIRSIFTINSSVPGSFSRSVVILKPWDS